MSVEGFADGGNFPPFRNHAFEFRVIDHFSAGGLVGFAGEFGLTEGGGLVGAQRELELHEPAVVEQLRQAFQLGVDPLVEFDLGGKDGEDAGDALLFLRGGDANADRIDEVAVQRWLGAAGIVAVEIQPLEQVIGEVWIIAFEIRDVESGVVRPEVCVAEVNLSERSAAAADHDAWSFGNRGIVKSVLSSRSKYGHRAQTALGRSEVVSTLHCDEVAKRDGLPVSVHDSVPFQR